MTTQRDGLQRFQNEITDFLFPEDEPERADIIFVPGNGYAQMAERAAQLWRDGYAPLILPSGRCSVTLGHFDGDPRAMERYPGKYATEWEFLRRVLLQNGVIDSAILRENRASYTYENAIYSRKAAEDAGIRVNRAILCCKNYHARRCLMYYHLLFPETEFFVCPSCVDGIDAENWSGTAEGITAVLGEIDRIFRQFNLLMNG